MVDLTTGLLRSPPFPAGFPRFAGRPDILKRIPGSTPGTFRIVQYEFKNLGPYSKLGRGARGQLRANIDAAVRRARVRGGGTLTRALLEQELRNVQYVIRGAENAHPALRGQIRDIMKRALPQDKDLADDIVTTFGPESFITFQGKGVPF